jgi:hypothetical protein
MIERLAAVLGTGILAGLWVIFQLWMRKRDPLAPGVEGGCGDCGKPCRRGDDAGDDLLAG